MYNALNKFHVLFSTVTSLFSSNNYQSVQSLSRAQLFVTPWSAAHQADNYTCYKKYIKKKLKS